MTLSFTPCGDHQTDFYKIMDNTSGSTETCLLLVMVA